MRISIGLFGTFFCATLSVQGQDFIDILKLDHRFSPNVAMTDSSESDLDISSTDLNLFLPVLSKDSTWTTILGGAFSNLIVGEDVFYSGSLLIGGRKKIGELSHLSIILIPKLSSDRTSIGSGDFQFGGYGLYSKSLSEAFKWKLGLYANGDRFGPLTVPIFGFKWQASPSLQVDLSLPIAGTVRKTVNEKLMVGLTYSGRKYSFNYTGEERYLEVAENNLWAFGDVYLSNQLVLNLRLGHSVLRDYKTFKDEDKVGISFGPMNIDDDRLSLSPSLEQGVSIKGGLVWRYGL